MSKALTLSIVIPVYNEEDYLEACLSAIACQSEQPDEAIVVDNNSTDNTAKIAKKYKFVRLLDEKRQGVFYANYTGFKAAKSTIIGRIDADTLLHKDWVKQVKILFSDNSLSAATGPVSYYDMPFPNTNYRIDHMMRSIIYRWFKKTPFLYGSNYAIRRSAWESVEPHLCRGKMIHEDIDLAIHLTKNDGKILFTKDLLGKASGRRYNDSPKDYFKYMAMYSRAYHQHHIHSPMIYIGIAVWTLGYIFVHPWVRQWYWLFGRRMSPYPFSKTVRKNPMSG